MSGLPKISGKECAAILEKIGFIFVRQLYYPRPSVLWGKRKMTHMRAAPR